MQNIKDIISSKGKIVIFSILIVFVLISIFIFNGFQKSDTTIVEKEDGTYIEASGIVENNSINISSEITGTIDELLVKEGDIVKVGQVIATVNNSSLKIQYDQAVSTLEIGQKNMELIESKLADYDSINISLIEQAKRAFLATEGEYERLLEGASNEEIQQGEEALNQANANLIFIESNLNNSEELLENGAISQKQYDEMELSYDLALAQSNSAKAKLDFIKSGASNATIKTVSNKKLQAKAAYGLSISKGDMEIEQLQNQFEVAQIQVEQAKNLSSQLKSEIDKLTIASPIDGILNLLTVNKGELTSLGKVVAEIYDTKNTEIKVYVSEKNIGYIKVGQRADIFTDSDTSKAFVGKVIRINNNAEFTPKNIQTKEERVNTVFEVKIQLMDSENVIKAGIPVDVSIKID